MLNKLFNIENKKLNKILNNILTFDSDTYQLTEEHLKELILKTSNINLQIACLKEITKRTLNITLHNVQLKAIYALYQGNIVEMKTGEGKTLVTGLTAVLHVLNNSKPFVVTVNEYLASRDAEYNKPIFDFLSITVGTIHELMDTSSKEIEYSKNIVYGTNSNFAFDYLKDNMVTDLSMRVNQGIFIRDFVKEDSLDNEHIFDAVIIDEVDSVLIDESRVPLIISGKNKFQDNEKILLAQNIYTHLNEGSIEKIKKDIFETEEIETDDFIVNKKEFNVHLTDSGIKKIENLLKIDNLFDSENEEFFHRIIQAISANHLFENGKDYIIKDEKIVLIDQSTGRLTADRQLSNGLTQAIEAKEGLNITEETIKEAEISYQNFFRLFKKVSGISGTVKTEEEEFLTIYNLNTIVIETNKPIIRKDLNDLIFLSKKAKIDYLINLIKNEFKKGDFQPILIGTSSVEENELLGKFFKENNISFNQLNAKNEYKEAEIIAHAGEKNTITLATNMAGRGVDIKLSKESKSLGGLFVIGFGRYKNRRIDNQLIGRSGRQGDPGKSQFLISLEDDLIKIFGDNNKIINIISKLGFKDNDIIETKFINKSVRKAQKTIESMEYQNRKELMKYDSVLETQREKFYEIRMNILKLNSLKTFKDKLNELINHKIDILNIEHFINIEDYESLSEILNNHFNITIDNNKPDNIEQISIFINSIIMNKFNEIENEEIILNLLKLFYLEKLDKNWINHLHLLETIKDGSRLESYNQKDPVVVYQQKSFKAFQNFIDSTTEEILKDLITSELQFE